MRIPGWMAGGLVLVLAGTQFGCTGSGTIVDGSGGGGVGTMRKQCPSDADCKTDVTVGPAGAPSCNVKVVDEFIVVHPGKKPMIFWELKPDAASRHEYRFDPRNGIDILGNVPGTDFTCFRSTPARPAEFRCRSDHQRPTPGSDGLKYSVNVQSRLKDTDNPWAVCDALDPRIINQ